MLLCGPLWVLCGPLRSFVGPLRSFAVFSHTVGECICDSRGDRKTYRLTVRASVPGRFVPMHFRSRERNCMGTKPLEIINVEQSYMVIYAPSSYTYY